MRKALFTAMLLVLAMAAMPRQLLAQAQQPAAKQAPAALKLKVGDTAPDFALLAYDGQKVTPVKLSDFRGKKNVALAFYVFAFTGG